MKIIVALGFMIGLSACAGGVSLAPHLNRERDLGPAAAAGRYGVVMDRAAQFENQNLKSRDVHWYRMWRASAMIGLGQVDQALQLIDQTMADISAAASAPAQADRLRTFGYDLRAQAELIQGKPKEALADLDRAFNLATEMPLETTGECDQPMMLAARSRQLEDVAKKAGDATRASSAHTALVRQLEKWTKCLAERDYPGMSVISALSAALSTDQAPAIAFSQAPPERVTGGDRGRDPPRDTARREREEPKAVRTPPPPEEKKSPPPSGFAAMNTVSAQYAPVDATPWKEAIDSAMALAGKHAQGAKADVVIRTDGQHHALRIRVNLPKADNPEQLIPLFRSTVVFFEQARAVTPKVERVLVTIEGGSGAPISVLAQKNDVLELFQERLDAAGFVKRLVRVM